MRKLKVPRRLLPPSVEIAPLHVVAVSLGWCNVARPADSLRKFLVTRGVWDRFVLPAQETREIPGMGSGGRGMVRRTSKVMVRARELREWMMSGAPALPLTAPACPTCTRPYHLSLYTQQPPNPAEPEAPPQTREETGQ